jgi:hypothetical protein
MFLNFKFTKLSQVWWYIPIILALRRLRQEECKFQTSLGYVCSEILSQKLKAKQNKTIKE